MKNIIITGGLGFIGHHAVKRFLSKGHTVFCIDDLTYAAKNPQEIISYSKNVNGKLAISKANISNLNWIDLFKHCDPDYIINYAASSHVDNSIQNEFPFVSSNYLGVINIIQHLRGYKNSKKVQPLFIQIGTDEEYGDLDLDSKYEFLETDPVSPNNPYSVTKANASLYLQAAYRTHGDFNYCICRATNNYGLGQHFEKFIPTVIKSVIDRKHIPIYGNGENIREWLYVEDFVNGVESIINTYENSKGHIINNIFNFGSGFRLANIEVVNIILSIMNASKNFIQFVTDRKGHDKKYAVNSEKAKKVLGWKATGGFALRIKDIINDISKRYKKAEEK